MVLTNKDNHNHRCVCVYIYIYIYIYKNNNNTHIYLGDILECMITHKHRLCIINLTLMTLYYLVKSQESITTE